MADVERLIEADRLVSEVHDAVYAEPYDRKAASDAVWRVHEVLRAEIARIADSGEATDG